MRHHRPATPCMPTELRQTMAQVPTGVALLASGNRAQGHCMTVNSFTSVSLDPPMVLVCVMPHARINACIEETGCFGLSVLAAHHHNLASHFADRRRLAGFDECSAARFGIGTKTGAPLLEEALAHLECRVAELLVAGDHLVYLAHVEAATTLARRQPMVFFNGGFTSVALPQPINATGQRGSVG